MKKAVLAMTLGLVAGTATGAFAKEATGTITSVNKKADAVTLSDGKTFNLPEGIEAETLHVGEQIRITYSTSASGKTRVSHIQPATSTGQ
ncbi:DUF1344 domain-containing protein [Rhizobium sp. RAF56]|uniref:DUF1344 domain-containing protein n=1 Tax=Rhizobium sp. RAF56 TaxID=3233062 RepID=UPI003F95E31B